MIINIDLLIKALSNYKENKSNNLDLSAAVSIYNDYLKNSSDINDIYILPENFSDLNLDDIDYDFKLSINNYFMKYPQHIISLLEEYGDSRSTAFKANGLHLTVNIKNHKSKTLSIDNRSYDINLAEPIMIQDKLEYKWTIPGNIKDSHLLLLWNKIKSLPFQDEFFYKNIMLLLPEELKSISIFD